MSVSDQNPKIDDILSILEAKTKKIHSNIESKNVLFLSIESEGFFLQFQQHFGIQKSLKNRKFSKKLMFEGVLSSTIALDLLFGWIFSPSELDFE